MRRPLITIAIGAVAALVLPAGAIATISEIGLIPSSATPTVPTATPSCPGSPCLAVSRTTGYQAKVGTDRAPFVVPAPGRIVAWSIDLAKPNAKQIAFFDANEGGAAQAGIAILRGGAGLQYSLVESGPTQALTPYFGEVVQFPLSTTLPVKKGDVIALSVPTWAPALALGYGNDTSWRASRSKAECKQTATNTTHTSVGSTIQYYCLYRTARLTYSATLVTNPTPTSTTTTTTSSSTTSSKTTSSKTTKTTSTTTTTSTKTTGTTGATGVTH